MAYISRPAAMSARTSSALGVSCVFCILEGKTLSQPLTTLYNQIRREKIFPTVPFP